MKKIVSILFTFILVVSAYAQSADIITEILDSPKATFGQICYLSAVQQNLVTEDSTYEDAIRSLYEKKQIPSIYDVNEPVPVIDAAYIFSCLWNVKGGLMYRITKGAPRYVFRQYQADGIIAAGVEPKSYISGASVLSMYSSCLRKYGDFDITAVSMEAE